MDSISSDGHTLSNHGPLQHPSSLIITSDEFDGRRIFSPSAFDRRKRDDDDDDDEISNSETGINTIHRQEVQSILQKTLMDETLLRLEKHDTFSALLKQASPPPSLSRHSSTGSRSSMSRSGAAAQRRLQMAISSKVLSSIYKGRGCDASLGTRPTSALGGAAGSFVCFCYLQQVERETSYRWQNLQYLQPQKLLPAPRPWETADERESNVTTTTTTTTTWWM